MEALLFSYGEGDGDDGDDSPQASLKKQKLNNYTGRYVSKRERGAEQHSSADQPVPSPDFKSVLASRAPPGVQRALEFGTGDGNAVPKGTYTYLTGHRKAVNAIRWSPTHGCLLASAGMDHKSCIWNAWDESSEPSRTLELHTAAVKDVQWSSEGNSLLTCGFDSRCLLIDVEKATATQKFETDHFVNVAKFHPFDHHLFVSGDAKGVVKLWDVRAAAAAGCVQHFVKDAGPVLDLDFSKDGRNFACTHDIAQRNSSDKSIIVWDFHSQISVSNQVYPEAYTCPCVRYHPQDKTFVAQSNADYIAIFSARPPFKLNKLKRYKGHQVSGFPVRCNFSPDGHLLVSGSADGCLYFYNYRSSKLVRRVRGGHRNACIDVTFHPTLQSTVASSGWDGTVCIYT